MSSSQQRYGTVLREWSAAPTPRSARIERRLRFVARWEKVSLETHLRVAAEQNASDSADDQKLADWFRQQELLAADSCPGCGLSILVRDKCPSCGLALEKEPRPLVTVSAESRRVWDRLAVLWPAGDLRLIACGGFCLVGVLVTCLLMQRANG